MSQREREIEIAGEELVLCADRAVHWRRRASLIVADLHWGKAATFRAAAIPVPESVTAADLKRLSHLLDRTNATRLVILGDLFHAREGRAPVLLDRLNAWRAAHAALEILLIRGNHDRSAGDPPVSLRIAGADGPVHDPPFAFCHEPVAIPDCYVLAGHVHPALRLTGRGGQTQTLPAFVFERSVALLPAFGSFTGSAIVRPGAQARAFVIAADNVLDVTREVVPSGTRSRGSRAPRASTPGIAGSASRWRGEST